MGIVGGLASHLFAFLIGFGASSFLSTFYATNPENKSMPFDILSPKFIAENKIFLIAFSIILFN
jgi:hypothetical protein